MAVQLLRPVSAGATVHFRGEVLRADRQVVFLRAEGRVDGAVVARAHVTKTRVDAGGGTSQASPGS